MNWEMIRTLLMKDLMLYFRNRFFAFVTILALVAYAVVYFVMPDVVEETLEFAMFAPNMPAVIGEELAGEGVVIFEMESAAALETAVADGDYNVGAVLPEDLMARLAAGEGAQIQLYFAADFPEEFKDLYRAFFEELGFMLAGRPLSLEVTEEVVGADMAGQQIPQRDRMLPLFTIAILMVETLGLASLISSEIESRTLQALLITPLRVQGLFVGKGLFGVGLAFVQAFVLMAVTGGLSQQPLLVVVLLLLGSLLATGIGFLIASVAKDMMSVMAWGILAIVLLAIPSFTVMIPGIVTTWIKVIPSFHLVDAVHRVINFGAGWGDVGLNLLVLLAYAVVFFGLGMVTLQRRFTQRFALG
ncbi:MAG: ABC transporter permease [Ardenticatenaceae bacterium]|nr:ABC transporter permease [Ardenticatenaceae bacterium]